MRLNPRWVLPIILAILAMQCSSVSPAQPAEIVSGVTQDLADVRARQLKEIQYDLSFSLPENFDEPIAASIRISCDLRHADTSLILDFRQPPQNIQSVRANGREIPIRWEADHIIIPDTAITPGGNTFSINFTAGDGSLNRSSDYLYTLLVPDRASTVFPCFDQPDLKARYRLALEMPLDWEASGNGAIDSTWQANSRKFITFANTKPFSTYVFGFAAGRFQVKTSRRRGQTMRMLYRETNAEKVAANANAIFDLHAQSEAWMREYTGISMPFGKMDFVLIPGFQYGGMEHIGNIFYRESSLMLEPDASENRKLGRARLIAHETAHMWFGNLVTMSWFNDVWLKEVFANFMAAKIVNPSFPKVNHDLNFLWSHLPSAYSEDRSSGSHPIQQELDNLKNAGTLYGRIIYQKAPVVMRQLEAKLGEADFRDGLSEYLQRFAYGNATWDDLIQILDKRTTDNLATWSEAWVKRAGMPTYRTDVEWNRGGRLNVSVEATNTTEDGLYWDQETKVALLYTTDSYEIEPLSIEGKRSELPTMTSKPEPRVILPNASEMSYGHFVLDQKARIYLMEQAYRIPDPMLRATAYWSLYEEVLSGDFPPSFLMGFVFVGREEDPLNQERLLSYYEELFWQYLKPVERGYYQKTNSDTLWEYLASGEHQDIQSSIWSTYQETALDPEHQRRLYRIWTGEDTIPHLTLSENRRISLATSLAIYMPDEAGTIMAREMERIQNPDQRERFAYLLPALSPDTGERKKFFESLKDPANRAKEPWVGAGLRFLHHPLRAETAISFIKPALEMMPEIQETGDIFFPRQWATATLSGHQSKEAARIVQAFMDDNPDLSFRLRNKIWMAADPLLRASKMEAADRFQE